MPLLAYIFVKRIVQKKRHVRCPFSPKSQGTGKFISKALVIGNKPLLSNMIDHKATQAPNTSRIAFLEGNYIFCSNFPAILCIIVISSYVLLYEGNTFEQKLEVASYIDFYS